MNTIVFKILIAAFSLVSAPFVSETESNNGIVNTTNSQQNSHSKVNTYSDPDFTTNYNETAEPQININDDLLNADIDYEVNEIEEETIVPEKIYVPEELIDKNIQKPEESVVDEPVINPNKITVPDSLINCKLQKTEEKEIDEEVISINKIYVPESLLKFDYQIEEEIIEE